MTASAIRILFASWISDFADRLEQPGAGGAVRQQVVRRIDQCWTEGVELWRRDRVHDGAVVRRARLQLGAGDLGELTVGVFDDAYGLGDRAFTVRAPGGLRDAREPPLRAPMRGMQATSADGSAAAFALTIRTGMVSARIFRTPFQSARVDMWWPFYLRSAKCSASNRRRRDSARARLRPTRTSRGARCRARAISASCNRGARAPARRAVAPRASSLAEPAEEMRTRGIADVFELHEPEKPATPRDTEEMECAPGPHQLLQRLIADETSSSAHGVVMCRPRRIRGTLRHRGRAARSANFIRRREFTERETNRLKRLPEC
jgi:hypothetical protein